MHLNTDLVMNGKPHDVIIIPKSGRYDNSARLIQRTIREISGADLPVINDHAPESVLPFSMNVILLGNRSTNSLISELYDRYYTLVDLWYPGVGGYVLKSLHNPFGNGFNAIIVGASDDKGLQEGTDVFVKKLRQSCAVWKEGDKPGQLTIGWLSEIKLGLGLRPPRDLRQVELWENCRLPGSYFGWNSLSKRMALYYMTGDEYHAREFLRLAFPGEQAKKELAEMDEEMIENKDDPIAGPYHYNAHLMILLWDLIEESPLFTDEQRWRITQSFLRQMVSPGGFVPRGVYGLTEPPETVGDRHAQYAALSLYCLARYFDTYYQTSETHDMLKSAQYFFAPLHKGTAFKGEGCTLYWYNTCIEAVLWYIILAGDKIPAENGVIQTLLRHYEILISGRTPDWALEEASLSFLHRAAYLTRDGQWLHYRNMTGLNVSTFRIGQSFYPDQSLTAAPPRDLTGKWSVWYSQRTDQKSYWAASYRNAPDATGDFILMVGDYDYGRTPYYSHAIIELRLAGRTLLQGYRNQVFTTNNGLANPCLSMNAALRKAAVLDGVAITSNDVACAGFCRWRRTLAQKTGNYIVIVDELTAPEDAAQVDIQIQWEIFGEWQNDAEAGVLRAMFGRLAKEVRIPGFSNINGDGPSFPFKEEPPTLFEIRLSDPAPAKQDGNLGMWQLQTAMKKNKALRYFSLIAPVPPGPHQRLACARIHANAAAIALPAAGIIVAGEYEETQADFAVLAADHLYGLGVIQIGLENKLLTADQPIGCYWDYARRQIAVTADTHTTLSIRISPENTLALDGVPLSQAPGQDGMIQITMPAGQHAITGALPDPSQCHEIEVRCRNALRQADRQPVRTAIGTSGTRLSLPGLRVLFKANVGEPISNMTVYSAGNETYIGASAGNAVHIYRSNGDKLRTLHTENTVDRLRWWQEHQLLLAGCRDCRVVAFDMQGNRKWTFLSEEDPAVFKAAKQYWFRTAPGHGGIHGLHTGIFLNNESQAFIGSACTLEIINAEGQLIKRMPIFWGPVALFAVIERVNGELHLLVGREPADAHYLAVIADRNPLKIIGGAFASVPPGHTGDCGGFGSTVRHHVFYDDINGDGVKELVGDVNGRICRVTVYDTRGYNNNPADGQPLYSAQLGPVNPHCGGTLGLSNRKNRGIRDLDIADLNNDEKKEIIAALSNGKVLALNCQCELIWSATLASPPMVLRAIRATGSAPYQIAAGCENGDVVLLDSAGATTYRDKLDGCPIELNPFVMDCHIALVFATDQGELKAVMAEASGF